MVNELKCGECVHYWGLIRPIRIKKKVLEKNKQNPTLKRRVGSYSLKKGHCLKKTIYASNRPGNDLHPPKAIVKETPDGLHKIFLVREDHVEINCIHATKKG